VVRRVAISRMLVVLVMEHLEVVLEQ